MIYLKDGSPEVAGYAPYASRFTDGAYIHGVPVQLPGRRKLGIAIRWEPLPVRTCACGMPLHTLNLFFSGRISNKTIIFCFGIKSVIFAALFFQKKNSCEKFLSHIVDISSHSIRKHFHPCDETRSRYCPAAQVPNWRRANNFSRRCNWEA